MFEIDAVKYAIEAARPYEVADEISDTYLQAIDIATSPDFDNDQAMRLNRRLNYLDDREDMILTQLERMEGHFDDDDSLVHAYKRTIEALSEIALEHASVIH